MSPDLLTRQDNACQLTDFDANADFYGFGIRLGVYLQWFSSWIANTLDPDNASENHEENSIFVLAIAIALVLAFKSDELKVSEAYILMLICTGYFAIVLSTWGIRLHLLRPGPVHVSPMFWHGNRIDNRVRNTRFSKLPGGNTLNAMANHYLAPRQMPLSQGGSVKPTGLSWAGAVWRSLIALFVLSLNLFLWFTYDPDIEDSDPNCRPTIYFFGSQHITSGLRYFFIAVLIIFGTIILQLLLQMLSVVYFLVVKCVLGPIFDVLRLGALKNWLLDLIHRRLQLANHHGIVPTQSITYLHVRSALFALSAQKPAPGHAPHVHPHGHHDQGYRHSMVLVLGWHVFLLTLMALFITFIEMTIQINNIQGAFVIKSTSQLIPFVIGLVSMVNTVRQLMLEWYEEDHPNEDNTHFVLSGSMSDLSLLGMSVDDALRGQLRAGVMEIGGINAAGLALQVPRDAGAEFTEAAVLRQQFLNSILSTE
ncbi:uncharacterized protein AB675_2971 [Cyphellophora attinorum]|uniref:Uncharacterized protein n=1 Tax=Cyphellophora attinorum TaxID=1664694 RepID=A0A0N1HJ76_9EURO|nr:uncharacterized protein AB675_2971 [Phialophora attinorum]KPI36414.1 hypothetical protein AB675_2971 [Phialophora attinorum]